MIRPTTWILWVICAIVVASFTRNPLYQVLIFLSLNILLVITKPKDYVSPISVYKFSAIILFFSTIFNMFISHFGSVVFFTLPPIPLIGGNYTLEAMVYGAINGMALINMLFTFNILNQVISTKEMIGVIPRSFFPLTLVLTISLTLIPSTRRQFDQVREAQAIRGHQMKSIKDWLPLFLPLLIGGMEHAYQLAETMTSRGFTQSMEGRFTQQRVAILMGSVLLIVGWLSVFFLDLQFISTLLMLSGGIILLVSFITIDLSLGTRSFTRLHLSFGDIITWLSLAVIIFLVFFEISGTDLATLGYNPYPRISVPGFDPFIGIGMVLFLVPGLLDSRTTHDDQAD